MHTYLLHAEQPLLHVCYDREKPSMLTTAITIIIIRFHS